MTTPILTKNQQRKSLSAKKGPVKGLKNVLAQPYENYWPVLKHDHGAALENLLKRLLPILKRTEVKVPWSQLRNMKKHERSAARRAAQTLHNNFDETIAKSIVFGINATTRLLEKDDSACILLDATVDPSLLVKHIAVMAQNKNVSILLVNFLKKVTLETIGFATAAIGLKKHVQESSENYFYALYEKVIELSLELPKCKTPTILFNDQSLVDEEIDDGEHKMEVDVKKDDVKPSIVSTDVYLYRTSKKERIFNLLSSTKDAQITKRKCADFISLENDDKYIVSTNKKSIRFFENTDLNSEKNKSNVSDNSNKTAQNKNISSSVKESQKSPKNSDEGKVHYKPLKVKRLQGNEYRTKANKPPKTKKK